MGLQFGVDIESVLARLLGLIQALEPFVGDTGTLRQQDRAFMGVLRITA